MAGSRYRGAASELGRLFRSGTVAGLSEELLLERFLETRDDVAFEAIVARHGPMVLSVCRQILGDPHDVEDAFQATFLILLRKAQSIRNHKKLGEWLHGVAHRVSMRARADGSLRRARDARRACEAGFPGEPTEPPVDAGALEQADAVHDEIRKLPDKYRIPIIMCYLEGLTHEQAAERLSWPLGSVKGRLARARDLLRSRLKRRGFVASAELTAIRSARPSAVPEALLDLTLKAATRFAAGEATAVAGTTITITAGAAALAEGVIKSMIATNIKIAAAAILSTGLVVGSASVMAYQQTSGTAAAKRAASSVDTDKSALDAQQWIGKASIPSAGTEKDKPGSLDGTPHAKAIPPSDGSAKAAQGTAKAEETKKSDLVESVRSIYQSIVDRHQQGVEALDPNLLYVWSKRILEEQSLDPTDRKQLVIYILDHLNRMETLRKEVASRYEEGQVKLVEKQTADFYVIEAEHWIANAKEGKPTPFDHYRDNPPGIEMKLQDAAKSQGGVSKADTNAVDSHKSAPEARQRIGKAISPRMTDKNIEQIDSIVSERIAEMSKNMINHFNKNVERNNWNFSSFPNLSLKMIEAEMKDVIDHDKTVQAFQNHRDRMLAMFNYYYQINMDNDMANVNVLLICLNHLRQSEKWLANAKAGEPNRYGEDKPPEIDMKKKDATGTGAPIDAKKNEKPAKSLLPSMRDERKKSINKKIFAALDRPIPMHFPNDTPIEEVLNYVRKASAQEPGGKPLPIYVDPIGLSNSDKTMASTVAIDLEGVPLRVTLDIVLKQLGLCYFVKSGFIYMTYENADDLSRINDPDGPYADPEE